VVEAADEGLAQFGTLFLLPVLAFLGRHNVDLPAGQFGGQADILPSGADRLRQVFSVNDDVHGTLVFIDDDGFHMRGRQGPNDEFSRIVGPQDDVDLFSTELITHCGDARTTHADAGADRVDALVIGDNRNFSADTRVA